MDKEKFNKFPKQKQARLVAHDVILNTLTRGNIKAVKGEYLFPVSYHSELDLHFDNIKNEPCLVCAKGALCYSYFEMSGKNTDTNHYAFARSKDLRSIFGNDFHIMEFIFENTNVYFGSDSKFTSDINTRDTVEKFNKFCKKLDGDFEKNRIEQIMRNYLFNDTIDLTNHPDPQEEIKTDAASGQVIMCNVHDAIDFS